MSELFLSVFPLGGRQVSAEKRCRWHVFSSGVAQSARIEAKLCFANEATRDGDRAGKERPHGLSGGVGGGRKKKQNQKESVWTPLVLSYSNNLEPLCFILYSRKLLCSFICAAIGIFIVTASLQNDFVICIAFNTPHKTFCCHKALSKLTLLSRNFYVP